MERRSHLLAFALSLAACLGGDDEAGRAGHAVEAGADHVPVVTDDDCTLTQGYWKNHEESWPVSSLTIGGESYTQAELLALFDTAPAGDVSLVLAHQLIAALLNVANGASTSSAVDAALADADAWMAANADADGRLPFGVEGDATATALADALASFNEGQSGVEHCDDPPDGGGGGANGEGGASGEGAGEPTGCDECVDECGTGYECVDGCCLPLIF